LVKRFYDEKKQKENIVLSAEDVISLKQKNCPVLKLLTRTYISKAYVQDAFEI